jgi:ABC-2 type transport system permease protein
MDSTGVVGAILRRLGPYGPVLAKEVRYLKRHPRYRVQVVSQFVVLIVGGAPFLAAILDRDPVSVLVACVPALTAGITSSNLLGADGRALWSEVLAIDSLIILLRGRALAFFGLGVGASTLVILGTAAWTGGWRFAPIAFAASIGMGFAGAGTGAYTSTLAPVLLPDETNPNPFASGDMGQGCVSGIFTFAGAFVGLLTSAPILVGLAYARTEAWAQVMVIMAAPVYGFVLFVLATRWAGRRADPKTPDLLAALS